MNMRRFLIFFLSLATLAVPTTSWEASVSQNLAINVTSGQAITAVSLSNNGFTGGAPSGTVVGAIAVTMSPSSPAFSGSLSLSGTSASQFQISGGNLTTNGVVAAGTYQVNIVATEIGVGGSPFTQAEAITGTNASASGGVAFTALNIRYMSPTGSDSANGLTPGTAWASPNHPMNCGDVIIAAAGTYTANNFNGGVVSNCPSTAGGIDGTGGIYFATVLCGGPYVGSCVLNSAGEGSTTGWNFTRSNWAVEGWLTSAPAGSAYGGDACASGTTVVHHLAFVNVITANSNRGFETNDCALNHNVPGNGVDYFAVVGSIAQNSNNDPIALAAIDLVGPANSDTMPGVHVFIGGNFVIANLQNRGAPSDGEGIMFDTWDAHGYVGMGVIEQNIVYQSAWTGLQVYSQSYNSSAPSIIIFNNTFYSNDSGVSYAVGTTGDINLQLDGGFPWHIDVYNNISKTNYLTVGGGAVYAMLTGGTVGSSVVTTGGNGLQNIFKGLRSDCIGSVCDSGNNVVAFNGFGVGTNIYTDPLFKNTADLLANHQGAPNCMGFETTTACMGWSQPARTVAALSVIDDLTATAAGAAGKGYHPPGPCTADPFYPPWLKGIVYLHWDGEALTQRDGLLTKPCGL
jgi:hypothetical protein